MHIVALVIVIVIVIGRSIVIVNIRSMQEMDYMVSLCDRSGTS